MTREGYVRKRMIGNFEQTVDEWDTAAESWKKKVRLTFEFDSWDEAVDWMNHLESCVKYVLDHEFSGGEE